MKNYVASTGQFTNDRPDALLLASFVGPCDGSHVCTKGTASAPSPSPSRPNNRRGTTIPPLHCKPQELPPCVPDLYPAAPQRDTWPLRNTSASNSMASVRPRARLTAQPLVSHILTTSSKLPTSRAPTPATTYPMAAPLQAPCPALSRCFPTKAAWCSKEAYGCCALLMYEVSDTLRTLHRALGLTRRRKPAVTEPACRRRPGELHHPHW